MFLGKIFNDALKKILSFVSLGVLLFIEICSFATAPSFIGFLMLTVVDLVAAAWIVGLFIKNDRLIMVSATTSVVLGAFLIFTRGELVNYIGEMYEENFLLGLGNMINSFVLVAGLLVAVLLLVAYITNLKLMKTIANIVLFALAAATVVNYVIYLIGLIIFASQDGVTVNWIMFIEPFYYAAIYLFAFVNFDKIAMAKE